MNKVTEDLNYVDLNPPMLYINEEERRFLLLLAPILTRSPRSLKRFVNVYRLIKVGMSSEQWDVYYKNEMPDSELQWSFKNFEIVMFLLSIVTGMPATSRIIFQKIRLKKAELKTMEDALKDIGIVYNSTEKQWFIFNIPETELPAGYNLSFSKILLDSETANNITLHNMQIEFLNFVHWLSNWKDPHIKMKDWLNMDINQLRYWDPYVSRFSFRIAPPLIDN